MCHSSINYESFRGVASDVFKTRNLAAVRSLKKFLTALPSPSYIRSVLLQTIYQLAEQDTETCRWVLHHHQDLKPELNLVEIAQDAVSEQLQSLGFKLNQDFSFTLDGQLETSEPIKAVLLERASMGDRVLLEELLLVS